nr:hypothetical protein [Nannocystis sp.]
MGEGEGVVPPQVAARGHIDREGCGDAAEDDDLRHAGGEGERGVDDGLHRHDAAAAPGAVLRDHEAGLAVDDPAVQGLGREAAEHHRMHGAEAGAGQHGDDGLRDHAHVDDHAVAGADAQRGEGGGEAHDLAV